MTRIRLAAVAAGLLALTIAAPSVAAAQKVDAKSIVDRVDRLLRGTSSRGTVTMQIKTREWARTLDMDIWSLGHDYALIRITAPMREAGTATLKVKDDVWNYLPHVDRTIRIPPSLMAGAWMGSNFTNDDLVKESRLVLDYDIALSFDGVRDGTRVWEFTLTPKPNAAVVWAKIVMQVRQADLMPVWERYYNDAGKLVRTITFSDYRVMGGRTVPATLTVVPADKPDEHTILTYHSLQFDVGLKPGFFSLQNLRRR